MNRREGYTTDVDFPAFFYKEMQPVWLASVCGLLGFAAPDVARPFRHCELGCGLGINLLVAAACHPNAQFVGVDFNPRHLAFAREAAQAADLHNVDFVNSDFAGFAERAGEGFDFMVTHGVWSWVSPQQRDALLACVNTGLRAGGLFYLHYMCHPGSTDLLNLQQLLNRFAPHVHGTSAQQVQMGLKLLRQLAERGFFDEQPGVLKHLNRLSAKDPAHLAHEFLTDHWQPQHSVDVHQRLADSGLAYLGSADVFNNLDVSLSIPGRMQAVIRQTGIADLAETLKDLARNSHQRMDLFQREPQPLGPDACAALLGAMLFQRLPGGSAAGPFVFATPIGPIEAPPALCAALLDRLASGPARCAELALLPAFAGQPALLLQTLQLMLMQALVHPVNPAPGAQQGAGERLTQCLAQRRIGLRVLAPCGTAVIPVP